MNTDFIKGIIPPIVTPVTKDERIDEPALRRQVDFVVSGGVSGILAFGSNGEFYMFEEDEMLQALEIIIDQVSGRVPVYLGVGEIRTSKCVRLAKPVWSMISLTVNCVVSISEAALLSLCWLISPCGVVPSTDLVLL